MIILRGKAKKPRKLTLSPTKISTYLACRVMYKYTYINHLSKFYYQPKAYHSFGLSLHRALEDYHKQGGAETQTSDQLIEKLHEVWTSPGYASTTEEEAHISAGTEFLEHYHEEHVVTGVKTLFTEKVLRRDMGDFNLMGQLDRIDEHPDSHLEIIDYKSGRSTVTSEEVKDDLAMGIYAYLAAKANPDRKITATIYCLRTGDKGTIEFAEEDLVEIEDGVRTVASEIALIDESTEIEPVWLEHVCPTCDYLRLCARKQHWKLSELMGS